MLPRPLQATIVFFAAVDLLAAVGLWLAAPWGGVLWLLCAAIEAVSPVLGARAAAIGVGRRALNVVLDGRLFLPELARRAGARLSAVARDACARGRVDGARLNAFRQQ